MYNRCLQENLATGKIYGAQKLIVGLSARASRKKNIVLQ